MLDPPGSPRLVLCRCPDSINMTSLAQPAHGSIGRDSLATVSVQGFTVIRDIFGGSTISVDVAEPATVSGVLQSLLDRYGQPLNAVLCDPRTGEITAFPMRLGDEMISSILDGSRAVKDGDELIIIFPVGGG